MRAMLTGLALLCGAGCTVPLAGPVPLGEVPPVPIGGTEEPPGGGLGPDGHGSGINSGYYELSAVCQMLLSSPNIPAGVCSDSSTDFVLPDTSYLNDPSGDACSVFDSDVAGAIDQCFAAACDGQLDLDDLAATHAMYAEMYVSDAEEACASSGQSLDDAHCAFTDVWTCP